jgi:hypothetical protein
MFIFLKPSGLTSNMAENGHVIYVQVTSPYEATTPTKLQPLQSYNPYKATTPTKLQPLQSYNPYKATTPTKLQPL